MRTRAIVLAAALVMAPLGASAADLVVWWEEGYYAEEDEALREIIAAFEQESGKQVELVFYAQEELPDKIAAALRGGPAARLRLRLVACRTTSRNGPSTIGSWTSRTPSATFRTCSIRTRSPGHVLNATTGQKALYGAADGSHDHTTSTSGRASWSRRVSRSRTFPGSGRRSGRSGATRCSRPCAGPRAATTSGASGSRCRSKRAIPRMQFQQFVHAYEADYVTRDGRLVIDDPRSGEGSSRRSTATRPSIARAAPRPIQRPGTDRGNNEAVPGPGGRHDAERVALDPERAQARAARRLLREHRHDRMAAWPEGEPFPIKGSVHAAVVFKDGGHVATAKEFVRFLVGEGWLAHYLDFSGERMLPSMPKLLDAAVLARPERPAPHGRGDAGRLAAAGLRLRDGFR